MAVQWYGIFADALNDEPVVAVGDAVRRHLRREPTRAEITAARRAANRFAARGHAVALHVPAAGGKRVLLLARIDADVASDVDQLHDVAAGLSARPTRRGSPRSELRVVDTLTRHACSAGRAARRVDVGKLKPDDAAGFVDDLTTALEDLERLRARLQRRAISSADGRTKSPAS